MNDSKQILSIMVDPQTGEITDSFRDGDSYKKYTREDKDKIRKFLKENDECEPFNEGVSFVKLYDDVLDDLSECLTSAEFEFAIRLAKHVSYKDCILRTNGNPNGKILNAQDLAELMKSDPSAVRRNISSLIKKGVLGKHVTGCRDNPNIQIKAITCNPYIFSRGNKLNPTAVSLFANSRWK
jgi:hypothetical protein